MYQSAMLYKYKQNITSNVINTQIQWNPSFKTTPQIRVGRS